MNLSIRVKLISFTFCIVLLVGGSIFLYSVYQGRQRFLAIFEQESRQTTAVIADTIVNDLYFLDLRSLRLRLESARVNPDISYTYVTAPDGAVLTDGSKDNLLRDRKLTDVFSKTMLHSSGWISRLEEKLLKVGGPIFAPDGSHLGYLQVGFSLESVEQTVRESTRSSFYITLICLAVGILLAFVLATSFIRPISTAIQAATEIGAGKLDIRLPVKRRDELGVLAESTNQMAEALQRRQAETERKNRELQALNAIATATSQSLDLKELFEIALDKTVEVTGREWVNIRLKDALTGKVNLVSYRGISEQEIEELRRRTSHAPTEQVFASGNPMIVNDTGENHSVGYLARTRSVAWIPIKVGARVVGVLGISDNQLKPFVPSEVELLQAIGSVIGVAIENARLFSETKRNLERLRALREIDQAITSTLDLRTVLDVLLEKIDLVLPYSATTVRLLNKESGAIEPVACRNLDEKEWKSEQWRGGRGIPNVVFETKAPVTISNVQSDPQNRDQEFFRKHGLVSYLGVPLIAKGEILGVFSFYTKEEHEFSNEEVEFLSTLAVQAAMAIHNSQLYEEMVKLAADLSKSSRIKDEFLSVMSHELRTPLNVVMGYSGMIKDRMLGEINAEQERALGQVMSRAREQLAMIDSILRATQLEAERVKVENHEFSLGKFLDDLRSNYEIPLNKELILNWDYPSDLPVVRTDSEKLRQVLQNLINNAIKFTERGQVTISARYLNGTGTAQGSRQQAESNRQEEIIEFKVSDTGIGIAKESFPVIFERFRQVDSSEIRLYGGVGMGLYLVKRLTELLGGEVAVESEPGKGSTFTVTIPCDGL